MTEQSVGATETLPWSSGAARSADIELAIFVLADGFRPDVFRALCESGKLPNFSRYLLREGSHIEGVTVLPSVTDVAYLPMLTGQYPGTANMPGIRWVDKSQFTTGKFGVSGHRSYVGPAHFRFNEDLPASLETLFELSPKSMAVRSDIHRGLSSGSNRFHGGSWPFMLFSHYLKRADFVDRFAVNSLVKGLNGDSGDLPRFIFLPLLDVDTASHARGPHHQRTLKAYQRIDGIIGSIVSKLKNIGVWDRTHLMVASDHGHTQTYDHLDLTKLISELGYSVFEHPSIYPRKVDAAVAVSGNAFGNVYVASEGRWERALIGDELEREHRQMLDILRGRPEVEWAAYRHDNGAIKIISDSGAGLMNREGERFTYSFDGADPLELGISGASIHETDALELTAEGRFPDALEQLWQIFTSERTGDLVVTSKPGYDLRGKREWPEHRSSHGALCSEHMKVPILSNLPLAVSGPARTVDIFPTIAESLELTSTKPIPGRSLW
ncbi:MAG: alkaline phosphatase family protein [SAR202 cluster bacterium]|nr:alkaline phosphatase family protein [SAR202 cluster bacterium]MDP6714689.1 alkaline phosphatase family protein [SAR202 cluster bacterium]